MFMIILLKLNFTKFVNLFNCVVRFHYDTFAITFLDDDSVVLHDVNDIRPVPEVFFDIFVQEFVTFQVKCGFDSLLVVDMLEFGFLGVSNYRTIRI